MVSNSALAAVSVWSGLHEFLLFESSQLEYGIQSYVNELKAKKDKEYELASQEGRSPGQYWLEIDPPKVSSDQFQPSAYQHGSSRPCQMSSSQS